MTLCEDDAKLTGPVALFLGVETATWNNTDFAQAADFAQAHGITTLFVKVSEVGSKAGDVWYGGWSGWDTIYQELQQHINVIPYAFVYGDQDIQKEIQIAVQMLQKYGKYCLDMEGTRWATSDAAARAKQFSDRLVSLPGKLWVSCPADPVRNNQLSFLQALSPAINIYMPMIYSDNLAQAWEGDFSQVNAQACLQPTFDLSQEFGANNLLEIVGQAKSKGIHAISLWEYQFAQKDPTLLDQVVSAFRGGDESVIAYNNKGEVADYPDVSQFEPNESEFECGAFAVASNHFAGPPGKGPTGTPEDVDQFADNTLGQVQTQGVSVEDMHNLFHKAGMHYWDIDSISSSSEQSHDQAQIKAALAHGYPVIVTIPEQAVQDLETGSNPYAPNWKPSGNHIITCVGIARDGNPFVRDTANVTGGIFGKIAPQPRHYAFNSLHISWASIVLPGKQPWLPSIPSGDPLSWPSAAQPQPQQENKYMDQAARAIWGAIMNLNASGPVWDKWFAEYKASKFHGPPLKVLTTTDWHGNQITVTICPGGQFEENAAHHVDFYPYHE